MRGIYTSRDCNMSEGGIMTNWPEDPGTGYGGAGPQDAWPAGQAQERVQPPPVADQPYSYPQPGYPQQGYQQQGYQQQYAGQQYAYQQQPAYLVQPSAQVTPYTNVVPQAGYGVAQTANNGMAVASLVLGITSIVFCWWGLFTVAQVALAIVFGCMGLSRANQGAGQAPMAIAGIICACAGLMFYFIIGVFSLGIFWLI
jgi:hypothetical protein